MDYHAIEEEGLWLTIRARSKVERRLNTGKIFTSEINFKLLPFAGEGEIFFAAESIVVTLIVSDISDADANFLASFCSARPERKLGCAAFV